MERGPRRVGSSNHSLILDTVTYALEGMHCTQVEGQMIFGAQTTLRMGLALFV